MFPDDRIGIPFEREIDLSIDLILEMQPIFIPPYPVALDELKVVKRSSEWFVG